MFWSRSQTHKEKVYWTFDRLQCWKLLKEFVDSQCGALLSSWWLSCIFQATRRQSLDKQILKQAMMQSLRSKVAALQHCEARPMRQETKLRFLQIALYMSWKKAALLEGKFGSSKMSYRSWEQNWMSKNHREISKWSRTSSPILVASKVMMVGTRGEVDPAAKLPIIAKRPAAQPTLMLSICGFWCFGSAAGKGRNVDAEKPA